MTFAQWIAAVNGTSVRQARRDIVSGAVRVNGVKMTDPDLIIPIPPKGWTVGVIA